MDRFFVENIKPGRVELPESEAHHALRVLRMKAGDELELFDGSGLSAVGRAVEATKRSLVVEVEPLGPPARRPSPAIELAFAVPKGKRLDWLLEKATELGVATLEPVIFARSVAGGDELSENAMGRWRGHCISAAKQCGLNWLPEIRQPMTLADWLAQRGADMSAAQNMAANSAAMARNAGN